MIVTPHVCLFKRETVKSLIHWFTPQVSSIPGVVLGPTETPSAFSC